MLKRIIKNITGVTFRTVVKKKGLIYLYAGDVPCRTEYSEKNAVGLSLSTQDYRHIKHDITKPYPLADETIDIYQAEDVFEHIEYGKLGDVIDEIYRVLKHGGYFRLSIPDYRCDVLRKRCLYDESGNIAFDPCGGGEFRDGKVVGGGHVWFPTYEKVKELIEKSRFKKYVFYHYYDEKGQSKTNEIDYSKGYVMRTPDHDDRVQTPYRAMSIVVDMFKE